MYMSVKLYFDGAATLPTDHRTIELDGSSREAEEVFGSKIHEGLAL